MGDESEKEWLLESQPVQEREVGYVVMLVLVAQPVIDWSWRAGFIGFGVTMLLSIASLACISVVYLLARRRSRSGPVGAVIGKTSLRAGSLTTPLESVYSVEARTDWLRRVLIGVKGDYPLAIPIRLFESPDLAKSFVASLRDRLESEFPGASRTARERLGDRVLALRGSWAYTGVLLIAMAFAAQASLGFSEADLHSLGPVSRSAIAGGDLLALFSGSLLHLDIKHFALNLSFLVLLTSLLGRVLGAVRFLLVLSVSALGGFLAHIILTPMGVVGASGAATGCIGAIAFLNLCRRQELPCLLNLPWTVLAYLVATAILLPTIIPKVAWQAHAGGFVAGFATTALSCRGIPLLDLASEAPLGLRLAFGLMVVLYLGAFVRILTTAARFA